MYFHFSIWVIKIQHFRSMIKLGNSEEEFFCPFEVSFLNRRSVDWGGGGGGRLNGNFKHEILLVVIPDICTFPPSIALCFFIKYIFLLLCRIYQHIPVSWLVVPTESPDILCIPGASSHHVYVYTQSKIHHVLHRHKHGKSKNCLERERL